MKKHTLFLLSLLCFIMLGYETVLSQSENLALNKLITVDSKYNDSYVAENAVDGDTVSGASRWVSNDSGYPHWIEIDLEKTSSISHVKFWTGYDGYNHPVTDYKIQYWSDSAWTDIVNKEGNANAIVSDTFAKIEAYKIRLYATAGDDNIMRLYEVQVWGTKSELAVTEINLDTNSLSLESSETYQLKPIIKPTNAIYKSASWLSSDTNIATVDTNGLVTAIAEGTANIMVTTNDGGFTDSCSVTVSKVSSISNIAYNVGLNIYPNPSVSNNVTIEILGYYTESKILLKVLDITGKTAYAEQIILEGASTKTQLNVSALKKGIYFISLTNNTIAAQSKLIIR